MKLNNINTKIWIVIGLLVLMLMPVAGGNPETQVAEEVQINNSSLLGQK